MDLSDLNRLLPIHASSCRLMRTHQLIYPLEDRVMEPWTSVDDIARHLGVARDSIYRWIERRGLPAHRIGRLWKFKVSEVDQWVRTGGADSLDRPTRKQ